MKKNKFLLLSVLALLLSLSGFAQTQVEMADTLRSNGKIYIVVIICLTILVGLFLYVWSVDRKVSRLEKK